MSGEPASRPDEAALRRDLGSGRFMIGMANGRWKLIAHCFPHVVIAVRASDGIEYCFRFECSDYPRTAATAQPWDAERDQPLEPRLWPTGRSRTPLAFNPGWKAGTCLYLPCDRLSIEGHDGWRQQHPALLWEPAKGICKYLGIIHQMLNSSDYGGRIAAAAA
jgi:hypothetical protein